MLLTIEQKATMVPSLLSTMVIFNDPTYAVLGSLGAVVSALSVYYEVNTSDVTISNKKFIMQLIRASLIGGVITMASFLLAMEIGGDVLNKWLGQSAFSRLLPSFWFLFTLLVATQAVPLYTNIVNRFKRGKK